MIKLSITGFYRVFFILPLTCTSNKCIFVRLKPSRMTFVPSRQKKPTKHGKCRFYVCVCGFQKIPLFSNVLSEQRSRLIWLVRWQIPSRQGMCGGKWEVEKSKPRVTGNFYFCMGLSQGWSEGCDEHKSMQGYSQADQEGQSHQMTSQSGAI